MDQPTQEIDQQSPDKRLVRWTWLLQVLYATRMLESRNCDYDIFCSFKSAELLEDARQLLFLIMEFQMSGVGDHEDLRTGSKWTWWDARFLETVENTYDPNLNDRDQPIDPDQETVPEGAWDTDRPPLDDALRESRAQLLRLMKFSLYRSMDNDASVQDAIKQLWIFFVTGMSENLYLQKWHKGDAVYEQWRILGQQGQTDFLSTFECDADAMVKWQQQNELRIVANPKVQQREEYATSLPGQSRTRRGLGCEWLSIANSYELLDDVTSDFIIEEGFKEDCADPHHWYFLLKDWDDLCEDECPICITAYDTPFEATMVVLKDHLWDSKSDNSIPVQMPCNHIICLSCFRDWAQSEMENKDKCPMCRGKLHPPNPQVTYHEEFTSTMLKPTGDEDLTSQKFVELSLDAIDTYLSRLPTSLLNISTPEGTTDDLNLDIWDNHVSSPTEEFVISVLEILPITENHLAWVQNGAAYATLECLHIVRDRVKAFLNGDQEFFRSLCQRQLKSKAKFWTFKFRADIIRLHLDYAKELYLLEAEQDNREDEDSDSSDEEEMDVGDAGEVEASG